MSNTVRQKRIHSVKNELLQKSREAALAAVQIYNNPQILFKSELFIVTMNIAWTYLLHAYFRDCKVDYRTLKNTQKSMCPNCQYSLKRIDRKKYITTKYGAFKHWELEKCLNNVNSPVSPDMANNLKFLIGIRHEIEHQMTRKIDETLSAKFQSCCLNYNYLIKQLFGEKYGLDQYLSLSLQFLAINDEQVNILKNEYLPKNINSYISDFEKDLSDDEFNDKRYAYRVIFERILVNNRDSADKVITFRPTSELTIGEKPENIYIKIKETEKVKYKPGKIVTQMNKEGFAWFKMQNHTELWRKLDGRNSAKGYGTDVDGTWYWYESWVTKVREYCQSCSK